MNCANCKGPCKMYRMYAKWWWRCEDSKCNSRFSILKYTIFYQRRFDIRLIPYMAVQCTSKNTVEQTRRGTKLDKVAIFKIFPEMRRNVLRNLNDIQLGGPGTIVEIDALQDTSIIQGAYVRQCKYGFSVLFNVVQVTADLRQWGKTEARQHYYL
ncbi:Hypothetical_protein [Hexamita inflata]|uniref:Hypothetical_protein n=1 Tax=Hexamita inflata TaxID=28002 RepID=A0ABP1GLT3_9EUKA